MIILRTDHIHHRFFYSEELNKWASIPEDLYESISSSNEEELLAWLTDYRFIVRLLAKKRLEQLTSLKSN